jgi:hypothetical protein
MSPAPAALRPAGSLRDEMDRARSVLALAADLTGPNCPVDPLAAPDLTEFDMA